MMLTREQLDELGEDLQCTEDWAPKTHNLVSQLLDEHAEQRQTIDAQAQRIKELEAALERLQEEP